MKTIKELHNDDKPREKLIKKGTQSLKKDELISIILGSGIKGKDVRKLSREIVSILDTSYSSITLEQLCNIHGLGVAKASRLSPLNRTKAHNIGISFFKKALQNIS